MAKKKKKQLAGAVLRIVFFSPVDEPESVFFQFRRFTPQTISFSSVCFTAAGHFHETGSEAGFGIGIGDEANVGVIGQTGRRSSPHVHVHNTRLPESQSRLSRLRRLQDVVCHR